MQHEAEIPRRTPPPVFCSYCGAGVPAGTATCAACDRTNPTAPFNGTLSLGPAAEELLSKEIMRTFGNTASFRYMPPQAVRSCAKCDGTLGPDAKFCRKCGASVARTTHLRSEPPRENVVPMPQPASDPEPPAPNRPVQLAYIDEFGEALSPALKLYDIDYLDSQLGLRAADIEPALTPPAAPAWRLRRHIAPAPKAREVPAEEPDVPAPRDPRPSQPSDATSIAVPGAVILAVLALAMAVVMHIFAPNAIPGYSAAEFDLKVQVRALEWLLGGILIAVVGLLLKR